MTDSSDKQVALDTVREVIIRAKKLEILGEMENGIHFRIVATNKRAVELLDSASEAR